MKTYLSSWAIVFSYLLFDLLPTQCFFLDKNALGRRRREAVRLDSSSKDNATPWFLSEDSTTVIERSSGAFSASGSSFLSSAVPGPPLETKPDYESIYGPLGPVADRFFQSLFRAKLAEHAGFDSSQPGYAGIIDIAAKMNKRYSRDQVQQRAQQVLISIFPSWMPSSYAVLFSKPFPAFSSRMNAWATWVAGTWLMGECELNDVILQQDDGDGIGNGNGVPQKNVENGSAATTTAAAATTPTRIGKNQGLLVKRCRFLEEAGCASVCVNSCKIPTQNFFMENMGLPLTMEPNYDTFECQFSFGKTPTVETELEAKSTPCLARCPTAGSLRKWHTSSSSSSDRKQAASTTTAGDSICHLMGE